MRENDKESAEPSFPGWCDGPPTFVRPTISHKHTSFRWILPSPDCGSRHLTGDNPNETGGCFGKAGKYGQAAEVYEKAAKAFEDAGKAAEQADALEKSATMYEKLAAQLERGATATKPDTKPEVKASTLPTDQAVKPPDSTTPLSGMKEVKLPPLTPKPGFIIGRVVKEDGSPVPNFKVYYSGFEKGKFFLQDAHVGGTPNISGVVNGSNGQFAIPVPDGLYSSNAFVEVRYHDQAYQLPLWPEPRKFDFPNQGLQYLKGGLVHDYVWRVSGMRGTFESSPPTPSNWYGGLIVADCDTIIRGYGQNSLAYTEPKGSHVELTLTPQGPLIDGSQGKAEVRTFDLGLIGYAKDIPVGSYQAKARVIEPDGTAKPLKISLTLPKYDIATQKSTIPWQESVPILFPPAPFFPNPGNPPGDWLVNIYLGEQDALAVSPN